MKRLVYINQVSNYLSEGIVEAMLRKGEYDEVVVMCGNPENVRFADGRAKIERIAPYVRRSFLTRLRSWVTGSIQIGWKLLTKYRNAEVFLVSNPPTACFSLALCRNRYKSLIYDIYPDGLVSGGFLSERNPLIRFWSWYNRGFFRRADRVFTITDGMAERLSRYVPRNRIEVVPIWYNPAIHRIPKENNEFIRQHGLEGKFIVMYSGNIGKTHNVEILAEAAEQLKEYEQIQFVIIGEGWAKKSIEKKVEDSKLQNVLFLPYQPLDFISHSLSAADLSFISLDEKISTVSVPSKTYNSLFVGSPLLCIASDKAELSKIVKNNGVGEIFSKDQISQISEYILKLSENKAFHTELSANAKNLSEMYSESNAVRFL